MKYLPLIAALAAGCSKHSGAPTASVAVAGHVVAVEIADEPGERARGLMYRDSLDGESGMLFVYPAPRRLSFWMENTKIPLSIAFIDTDGRILNIEPLVPMDRTSVPSSGEALYALEVNRDWFQRKGVGPGDVVTGLPGPSQR